VIRKSPGQSTENESRDQVGRTLTASDTTSLYLNIKRESARNRWVQYGLGLTGRGCGRAFTSRAVGYLPKACKALTRVQMNTEKKSPIDQWTVCAGDHIHWGAYGGAGLLLCYAPPGELPSYLLQQRSKSVDHGGTWGIPGGAMRKNESPEAAARREAEEEIGPIPAYRVTGIEAQDCGGGWNFYVVTATVDRPFDAFCVRETDATGWFTREDMRSLNLHPDFQKWLEQHLL